MKSIILIFVGHYLPGTKSGGILRTVNNTIENLAEDFEFIIVTRNTDVKSLVPYPDIKPGLWVNVGKARVLYLDKNLSSYKNIVSILNNTECHAIHLNSFFDSICIKVLFAIKFSTNIDVPVVLSPRGEFAWASFKIKLFKKLLYITSSKLLLLYEGIIWHVSNQHEKKDLVRIMNISDSKIKIAEDLPIKPLGNQMICFLNEVDKPLKVLFLSRISPEKNLTYALKILGKSKLKIIFDIYGFIADQDYWQECRLLITEVQAKNSLLSISYLGEVQPEDVITIFSKYDLFFFPSGGENYGHVIAESLISGTPVLISNKTPWNALEGSKIGWDFSLKEERQFIDVLGKLSTQTIEDKISMRLHIIDYMNNFLGSSVTLKENKKLYNSTISELQ